MIGGNVVNRNGFVVSRIHAQLNEPTVRFPRKRIAGGALDLVRSPAAPATTIAAQRLFLQSGQVARELSLDKAVAGPGSLS